MTSPELGVARLHSRSSHTHKVATISREIAENLVRRAETDTSVSGSIFAAGGLDVTACESAGLGHDLGHPPFGHAGESQLDYELRNVATKRRLRSLNEGFEGNAQSFRIVTRLDRQNLGVQGLNLTNVTLAAILKYPHHRKPGSTKFGAYRTESPDLERSRKAVMGSNWRLGQSLEASIMDVADDIAYAVHDLEDFCGAGILDLRGPKLDLQSAKRVHRSAGRFLKTAGDPFSEAAFDLRAKSPSLFDEGRYLKALSWTEDFIEADLPDFIGVPGPEKLISLRQALSPVIALMFKSITIQPNPVPVAELEPEAWHRLQCLKIITKRYLVSTPQMGVIQKAQKKVISNLFTGLAEWLAQCPDESTVPPELKDYIELAGQAIPTKRRPAMHPEHYRAISDYICGLSDAEALRRSQWVTGTEVPGMALLGLAN